jgi:hypothetical protein
VDHGTGEDSMGKHLGVMREVRGKWREGMEQNKCKEEGMEGGDGTKQV